MIASQNRGEPVSKGNAPVLAAPALKPLLLNAPDRPCPAFAYGGHTLQPGIIR